MTEIEQVNVQQRFWKFLFSKGIYFQHSDLSAVTCRFKDTTLSWYKVFRQFTHFWEDQKYVHSNSKTDAAWRAVSNPKMTTSKLVYLDQIETYNGSLKTNEFINFSKAHDTCVPEQTNLHKNNSYKEVSHAKAKDM